MSNKANTLFLICSLIVSGFYAKAQSSVNSTEIWLVDLITKDGSLSCGIPLRITNNDYYDNQPCFSADGKFIYYTSMPDTPQTDIMEYDTRKKTTRRVTKTPESEYQPQPIPGSKNLLSVVRVNDEKAQGFYSVNMDGTEFINLSENDDSLAYYTWLNDTLLGFYILNSEIPALEQFDMTIHQSVLIMEGGGFGRCLQKIPGSADLSYVDKSNKDEWLIYNYSFENEDTIYIGKTIKGEEDYCWTPGRQLLMGSKGKLFCYDTNQKDKGEWKQIADFTKTIGSFYRLAINNTGDKLAIVSYTGMKP